MKLSNSALPASLLADAELPESGNSIPPSYLRVSACTSGVTELPESELPALTPAEIAQITRLLVTGVTRTHIAKQLPGYSPKLFRKFKAKVDAVAGLLADDKADDLDQPGGPNLPDAFNF